MEKKLSSHIFGSLLVLAAAFFPSIAHAHCQVPCGIFDDKARIAEINEHIVTIEKANTKIGELSGKTDAQSLNQLTRWVMVKEQHAERINETVANYFLAQRVKKPEGEKADPKNYLEKLASHHEVMIAAMKAKQAASADSVTRLKKAVGAIASYY